MKKAFTLAIVSVVIFIVGFLGYKIYSVQHRKQLIAARIVNLPGFHFYKLDNTIFSSDSVANDYNRLIIMFFSPDCEHCQYTAKSYVTHKQQLDSTRILMVTLADSSSTARFSTEYQLDKLPNVTVLRDPEANFPKTFGSGVIPTFLVYKNKKLINKFTGETKVDNLLSNTTLISK